jgi:hypothetical protein
MNKKIMCEATGKKCESVVVIHFKHTTRLEVWQSWWCFSSLMMILMRDSWVNEDDTLHIVLQRQETLQWMRDYVSHSSSDKYLHESESHTSSHGISLSFDDDVALLLSTTQEESLGHSSTNSVLSLWSRTTVVVKTSREQRDATTGVQFEEEQ